MRSITSTQIIRAMEPIFARFGIPFSLRTDNGTQFVSDDFRSLLDVYGIEHWRNIPYWPSSNGEIERQNRTLLKAMKIVKVEGKTWRDVLK